MNLLEFVNKYTGKKIDFDGAYGAQCVDLFRQYCRDVWELPHLGAVEGAADLWNKYNILPLEKQYLCRVAAPEDGDAVIFGPTATNPYGHVAIVVRCGVPLLVFEQDGFKQDAGAHLAVWKTDRILGFLRRV
jgi:hypothetical protein